MHSIKSQNIYALVGDFGAKLGREEVQINIGLMRIYKTLVMVVELE
jgi:hypothetical protein